MFLLSSFSGHYYFEYISEVLNFPIDTTHCDIELAFYCLYFRFHQFNFPTILKVLKLVLCFSYDIINYGAKGVRDADRACRCNQSNIMPDSIFSVNIAQCAICG